MNDFQAGSFNNLVIHVKGIEHYGRFVGV